MKDLEVIEINDSHDILTTQRTVQNDVSKDVTIDQKKISHYFQSNITTDQIARSMNTNTYNRVTGEMRKVHKNTPTLLEIIENVSPKNGLVYRNLPILETLKITKYPTNNATESEEETKSWRYQKAGLSTSHSVK